MKSLLKNIVHIQAGYSFRTRLEAASAGVLVVQMGDLTPSGGVDLSAAQRIDVSGIKPAYSLQRMDLIFRSRGFDLSTALLDFEPPEPLLLAAPLYRMRVAPGGPALPEYLHWYFQQEPAQAYIHSCTEGTAQKMISKQSLGDLPVDLPNIERQALIVEIATLFRREAALLKTLSARRQALISTQLMQLAKGEN